LVENVGRAAPGGDATLLDSADFQGIEESLGVAQTETESGHSLGLLLQSVGFLAEFAPKLFTWDFSFFTGPFEYVQWGLIMLSASVFIHRFGQTALGAVSGVVGGLLGRRVL